ncbi:hypothetical protein AB3M89_13575 [Microbacterium sp. 179-I 3D2 NHS]|uniref:hypothetical protein n=1 Tax=Microbacterium sp. 179-I 3D2 NHS TaxID=3235178 RepID=UPI0039A11016
MRINGNRAHFLAYLLLDDPQDVTGWERECERLEIRPSHVTWAMAMIMNEVMTREFDVDPDDDDDDDDLEPWPAFVRRKVEEYRLFEAAGALDPVDE